MRTLVHDGGQLNSRYHARGDSTDGTHSAHAEDEKGGLPACVREYGIGKDTARRTHDSIALRSKDRAQLSERPEVPGQSFVRRGHRADGGRLHLIRFASPDGHRKDWSLEQIPQRCNGALSLRQLTLQALDTKAIIATFAKDAHVNDKRREIVGIDAIRRWVGKEIVGDRVTIDVRKVVDHHDDTIVRGA